MGAGDHGPSRPAGTEPFAAAVLCGGRSRRMGRDKAFVAVGGEPMVHRVVRALREAGAERVVTIGGDGARLRAEVDADHRTDRYPGEGPLGGLLVALETGDPVVVVVACDLPDLTASAIGALVEALRADPAAALAAAEPLCAAWRPARARVVVEDAFVAGCRAVHEVIALLPNVRVAVDPAALRNVNRPGDVVPP